MFINYLTTYTNNLQGAIDAALDIFSTVLGLYMSNELLLTIFAVVLVSAIVAIIFSLIGIFVGGGRV